MSHHCSAHGLVRGVLALAAALIATSALAQDVAFNAMPGTDFGKYKTYRWVSIKDAQQADQITMLKNFPPPVKK
jgi:hypothetical protein